MCMDVINIYLEQVINIVCEFYFCLSPIWMSGNAFRMALNVYFLLFPFDSLLTEDLQPDKIYIKVHDTVSIKKAFKKTVLIYQMSDIISCFFHIKAPNLAGIDCHCM